MKYNAFYASTGRQQQHEGSEQEHEPKQQYDCKIKDELTEEGDRLQAGLDEVVAETSKQMEKYAKLAEEHREVGGQ